jgi:hypothetical protein
MRGVGTALHPMTDTALDTRRINMDVMEMARSIGLVDREGHTATGTIEEQAVLAAISELADAAPQYDDLFADAAMQVELARSAGVVEADALSILHRSRGGAAVQLRYRSEMAEIFIDLAIDVGLRAAAQVDAGV